MLLNKGLSFVRVLPHALKCVAKHRLASNIRCQSTAIPYTSDIYNVKRTDYSYLSSEDVDYFKSFLGGRIVMDENELDLWNTDWIKTVRGKSKLMLKPKTTEEVSKILSYCNSKNLAICPQGGNTGLVGGSVPVFDEIILSTALMNNVISVDRISGIMVCQSGCILQNLSNYLDDYNMIVPLDLGAKGSCHIGGNLATNAGGLRLLRYGSLKGNIIGLEVVLADGCIMKSLDVIRKNNTGYDLKQIFVGSEGTLGVITSAAILCPQKPSVVQLSLLAADSFEDLTKLLIKAREKMGEILSAVEFQDNKCMQLVQENLKLSNPIGDHPFYMLVETSGCHEAHDAEKLEAFIDEALSSGLAKDGTMATDNTKMSEIWELRERLAEALTVDGYTYKYDISLPTLKMYEIVNVMKERLHSLSDVITVCGYGHLGDGNLHFNVTSKNYSHEIAKCIEPYLYEYTVANHGSISAEHGVGFKKRSYISMNQNKNSMLIMKQLKHLFDPKQILNPYKVLPDD